MTHGKLIKVGMSTGARKREKRDHLLTSYGPPLLYFVNSKTIKIQKF